MKELWNCDLLKATLNGVPAEAQISYLKPGALGPKSSALDHGSKQFARSCVQESDNCSPEAETKDMTKILLTGTLKTKSNK